MATPFEELAGLDRMVHEPGRLAIMTALSACKQADFLFLQNLTGLTKGNLSTHLTKLEEAGLLEIDKQFVGKKPLTMVRLSGAGRTTIEAYWQQLDDLRSSTQQWKPDENEG